MALFRKEVAEYQQAFRSGQVLLLRGWPTSITVMVTLLIMTALLLFLLFGSYTRRINVNGELITLPHTINLFAPEQGRITRLLVQGGQIVKAGTPLYMLDVSRISSSGNLSATTIQTLKNQRQHIEHIIAETNKNRQATLGGLQQQLERYLQAQQSTAKMVSSASEGLRAMQQTMSAYQNYRQRGLVTTDQQNNQRYLYYQQQSSWQNLNIQAIQQDLQIAALRSELVSRQAEFDSQIAQYRIQQDDLERQMAEAEVGGERVITAPADGRVSSLSVTEGQMVNGGDSLAQLVPAGKEAWRLILWLPGESVPWVHSGDNLNIRYNAFPFQKYGQFAGRVLTLTAAPVPLRELSGYASAPRSASGSVSDNGWFKALVQPELPRLTVTDNTSLLTSGMQVQATIFLEKRPLWQWMLSPYYTLKAGIRGAVHDDR